MDKNQFLYMQLYEDIKAKIENQVLKEDTKLPSDKVLAKEYKVSLITVKKALTMLKEEGYIRRVSGVGSFVNIPQIGAKLLDEIELPEQKIQKIGVVLEHISSAFGVELLNVLEKRCDELGYKLFLRFSNYNREKETKEIQFLLSEGIVGLIVMPCHGTYYNPLILQMIIADFPVVMIDKKLEGISVSSVRTANLEAMLELVAFLAREGKKRIGYLTCDIVGTSSLQERMDGYAKGIEEQRLIQLPLCTLNANREKENQEKENQEDVQIIKEYIENEKLDGLICAEYYLLQLAKKTKISNDLQICCMDGPLGIGHVHMLQDEERLAIEAVRLLLKQIENTREQSVEDIIIPAKLILS